MKNKINLFQFTSELLSLLIFISGLVLLYGWISDVSALKSIFPGAVGIKTNTTICFISIGLGLWFLQEKRMHLSLARLSAMILGSLVLLIGFLTFSEYVSGINLGIDNFLLKEPVGAILTSSANRMAFTSSINFILVGSAVLLLLQQRKDFFCYLAQSFAFIAIIISLITLLGYIYGGSLLYLPIKYSPVIAINATFLFILTGICIMFSRPKCGFMKTVSSEGPGGVIMRVVYPIAILIPMFLGWLKLYVEKEKIFTNETGVLFVAIVNLTFISIYLYALSRRLNYLDIERQKGEQAQRLLVNIVESSDDAIIGESLSGTILSWNKAAERMYGYSFAEVKGKNASIIIPAHKEQEMLELYKRIKRGEHIEHFETEHCRKDGSCMDISLSISPLKDDRYGIVGFSAIARDISERKIEHERILKDKQYLEMLINSLPGIFYVLDADANILLTNRKLSEVTGYSMEEVLKMKGTDFFSEKDKKLIEEKIRQVFEKGEAEVEAYLITKAKKIIPHYFNGMRIVKDEKPILVGMGIDITERKSAENKLKESLRLKTDFTNLVSHELRTPLAAIKESVSIVLDDLTDPAGPKQKELLSIAQNNIDRLTRLINDILDFQKLESGKVEFRFEKNDLNEAIGIAVKTITPVAMSKGLDIILKLEDNLPRAAFDPDKIIQVLSNLLNNSLKFTEKGNITISTVREGNVIKVTVADTGPGIKNDDLSKLFVQYGQLERAPGSTGLGLAISREIIRAHGGKIWAESKFGQGLTVHFVLPIIERRERGG